MLFFRCVLSGRFQMTIRKAVFILIFFVSITCSGCFTGKWNELIDAKITGCPPHSYCNVHVSMKTFYYEPDSFGINDSGKYPEYKRCDYIGKEAIKGVNYHHYMCPNMYNDSKHAYLELFIPDAKSGSKWAIIKSRRLIWAERKNIHNPVYIHFTTSPPAAHDRPINPYFIRKSVDRSLGSTPFPANYPSLISMNYNRGGHNITLDVGQKVDRSEAIDLLNSRDAPYPRNVPGINVYGYQQACAGKDKFISFRDATNNPDCELWYMPRIHASGTDVETSDKTLLWEITRYIGDIITVPLDIITGPIQLYIIIKYAPH